MEFIAGETYKTRKFGFFTLIKVISNKNKHIKYMLTRDESPYRAGRVVTTDQEMMDVGGYELCADTSIYERLARMLTE